MEASNLLILVDDQHNKNMLGCYGHPLVKTPNLDQLARRGTRFTSAYTPSPLCVAARGSLATGRYVHETRCWDNASGYDGTLPSWALRLQQAGIPTTSIGKLHYKSETISSGFDEQIIPMHMAEGVGDIMGSVRPDLLVRYQSRKYAENVGPGDSEYIHYDREIAARAEQWLTETSENSDQQPWVLFVSFIAPHFPLIVPQKYYDLYPLDDIALPKAADGMYMDKHPWWNAFKNCMIFDQYFEDDDHRKRALASYFGLCTFTDENIGLVLNSLEKSKFSQNTRVLFFSDHGDCMGARGIWGKSTMHEESAGIPMILAGPDVPSGKNVSTPVSLLDVFPTVLHCVDVPVRAEDGDLSGVSLIDTSNSRDDGERYILSEYHGAGSITAAFMIRKGRYKYVHYTNFEPELFDLETDPEELTNLFGSEQHTSLIAEFEILLRSIVDPEVADQQAKTDQAILVKNYGGVEKILEIGGLSGTPVPGGSSTRV